MGIVCGVAAAACVSNGRAATTQVLYSSDWTGPYKVLALNPTGGHPTTDVSILRPTCRDPRQVCGFARMTASPDGRRVAFASESLDQVWIRTAYGGVLPVARVRSLPVWSRDSRRLAYIAEDGLHVADADGGHDRLIDRDKTDASPTWGPPGRGLVFLRRTGTAGRTSLMGLRNGRIRFVAPVLDWCDRVSWSANGRFFACSRDSLAWFTTQVFNTTGTPIGRLLSSNALPEWSPTGARLLLGSMPAHTGVRIFSAAIRRVRALRTPDDAIAVAWSPLGGSVAYLSRSSAGSARHSGDIRELTLKGKIRTLVRAEGAGGGTITSLTWTRSPGGTAWPIVPAQDGILADGAVSALAAGGDRVAYVACGLPFVWAPAAASTMLLPPPTTEPSNEFERGCRSAADRRVVNGIAVGSEAALYDWCNCPTGYSTVQAVPFASPSAREVGRGSAVPGLSDGLGTVMGDDSLLVFSGWRSRGVVRETRSVTGQWIQRIDGGVCPCPVIAEQNGRLQPLDVDAGRIVARRGEATVMLDAAGHQLQALPVTPTAAQLSGSDLVVLAGHALRGYDTATGALRSSWPIGPISAGRECQGWFDPGCFIELPSGELCDITGFFTLGCGEPDLRLEDAALGLVTYVMDNKIWLRRLSDGKTDMVSYGSLSRFTKTGLVFADGARLHFVPFESLPIH